MTDPAQAALLHAGDRLARHLTQTLNAGLHDQTRLHLLGRSLASNLIGAFIPTVEHVSRHAGTPLHALLDVDAHGQPLIHVITADGETRARLPATDLLMTLLFRAGHLHPTVRSHLQDALSGSEHHAERALVACLRSKPVLDALHRELNALLRPA